MITITNSQVRIEYILKLESQIRGDNFADLITTVEETRQPNNEVSCFSHPSIDG